MGWLKVSHWLHRLQQHTKQQSCHLFSNLKLTADCISSEGSQWSGDSVMDFCGSESVGMEECSCAEQGGMKETESQQQFHKLLTVFRTMPTSAGFDVYTLH